ncbi:hypothetical protein DV738_g4899, partial [Chaetothyriales sp. CBS 135597]
MDAANLRGRGLLTHGNSPGTQRLHKRLLTSSSNKEFESLPLSPAPGSVTFDDDAFATIPTVLRSYQTLLYLGFSEQKAREMWRRWNTWPTSPPSREIDPDDGGLQLTFIEFVTGPLRSQVDAFENSDAQWYMCLNGYGIATEVQDAIMDPRFTYLRTSASCFDWVRDTIEMRYEGLDAIQQSSCRRETQLRQQAMAPPRAVQQANISIGAAATHQTSVVSNEQESRPGRKLDLWGSPSAFATCRTPGCTVLFKAVDHGRIAGLFDETGALSGIQHLLTMAEFHAAYAKRRANCESVVILCLRIPNAALLSLSEPDILRVSWPSPEWKELVWHGRNRQRLPPHLEKYQDAVVVLGTPSRKARTVYALMKSWEEVTRDHAFFLGSHRNGPGTEYAFSALQYVFNDERGEEFLLSYGARDMQQFIYPESQLELWLTAADQQTEQKQQQTSVPLSSLPLPTLSRLQQQLSSELEHLTTSYQRLRAAQARFRDCITAIQKVQSAASTTQLIPLTTSLYVPATRAGPVSVSVSGRTVLVDVGTGFYVEKSYDQGVRFYEGKVADLEASLKTVEESVKDKTATLRTIEDAMRREGDVKGAMGMR